MLLNVLLLLSLLYCYSYSSDTLSISENGNYEHRDPERDDNLKMWLATVVLFSVHRYSIYTRDARAYVFRQSTRAAVIITPSLPIRYNNINYYWYGNYVYDASHPLKCEYPIDLSADKEFQNVTYPDGSKPPSLQFGCLNYEDCCGLECCGDSRTSTVLICGIFLVTLASCVGYKKYQRYQIKKSDEMTMVTTYSALQPLLVDSSIEVHAV